MKYTPGSQIVKITDRVFPTMDPVGQWSTKVLCSADYCARLSWENAPSELGLARHVQKRSLLWVTSLAIHPSEPFARVVRRRRLSRSCIHLLASSGDVFRRVSPIMYPRLGLCRHSMSCPQHFYFQFSHCMRATWSPTVHVGGYGSRIMGRQMLKG